MPRTAETPTAIAETSRIPAICARIVGTAVLAASMFLFLLATPPFAYGVWFQSEPVTVGLLAAGAAAGVCILALDLTGHSLGILLARRHVQILLVFVGWNAFVSCFQSFPGRSWLGTPETGEGILSFLALASLMLLASVWLAAWASATPESSAGRLFSALHRAWDAADELNPENCKVPPGATATGCVEAPVPSRAFPATEKNTGKSEALIFCDSM